MRNVWGVFMPHLHRILLILNKNIVEYPRKSPFQPKGIHSFSSNKLLLGQRLFLTGLNEKTKPRGRKGF